jgi:hypothetical protein
MENSPITKIKVDIGLAYNSYIRLDLNLSKISKGLVSWKECIENTREIDIVIENKRIKLCIDWGNSLEKIYEQQKHNEELHKSMQQWVKTGDRSIADPFFQRTLENFESGSYRIGFTCTINTYKEYALDYLNRFLHILYFALNLSSPGSININNTKLEIDRSSSINLSSSMVSSLIEETLEKSINKLSLDSEPLGRLYDDVVEKYGWPEIKEISFKKVWNWLLEHDFWSDVNAETNIQKAIFALMYSIIAHSFQKQYEIEMIYLAFALEALFDTPEQGISNSLRERIFLVLGTPQQNIKKVRQEINSFYEARSKFAHGDMKLINPVISNSENTMDYYAKEVWSHCAFAQVVLISSFQKMIENNWKSLKFFSTYYGE